MKNLKIFIIVLLLFPSSFLIGQNSWQNITFKEHHFSVNFFGDYSYNMDTTTFDLDTLYSYYWDNDVEDEQHDNIYYSVGADIYPAHFIHSDSAIEVVEEFINSTQNDLLNDPGYKMLSSSQDEKQGYFGKIFKWLSNENGAMIQFQVYLVDSTLYQLSLVTKADRSFNTSIEYFFNSFELLDVPNGNFKNEIPELISTFHIAFPGEPITQKKLVDSEFGKLNLKIQVMEPKTESDTKVYVAMETKYPETIIDTTDAYALNKFYKSSIDGSLAAVSGELISVKDIFYHGYRGKQYKAYFSGGQAMLVYRVFYLFDSLYSFGVITTPNKEENPEIIKFLDSFNLLRMNERE